MSDFLSAGRLEDHPFAELSGLIFQEGRTGGLELESGSRRRTVWFLGGNPVAVVSDDPQDHLSQFLLEHGKIGAAEAHRLAELPETREALGSADFLPKETLNWGVKSRFVNLCYDLFRWEDGDYTFSEGDPPRELFMLKVPAHSLIFKGVGLLGQAAVFDAVPDDAVCAAGPVASIDARYLSADAHQLLEQCRPGRTVAEALGGGPGDVDQARRLLYALACLGLVALSRGPAAPGLDEEPGFMLDEDDADTPIPTAAAEPEVRHAPAVFSLEEERPNGKFTLELPPLGAEYGSLPEPSSEFDAAGYGQPLGSHPLEEGAESFGSFGSFNTDTPLDHHDEPPSPAGGEPAAPAADAKKSGRRFHLPRLVGIGLGSLAAAGIIAFAAWWWMSGSEPPPPPVKPPVRRPADAGGTPVAVAPAPSTAPTTPPAVPAPSAAVSELPPPPATAPASPTPPPPLVAVSPAPPAAASPSPSAPRPAGIPAGGSGTDRNGTALELFRAGDLAGAAAVWEALLAEEHRGAFTVQVLTACQPDTVREAQRSLSAQKVYLVTKKMNGRVCYRICLGTFDSREAASRALAGLPGTYRTAGASVRPVGDVLTRDR